MNNKRILQGILALTSVIGILCLIFTAQVLGIPREVAGINLYVSVNGSDTWTGSLPAPNAARNDGPFATLERARDAIRQLKAAGKFNSPVTVMVRRGTYQFFEPFILHPEDSGTEDYPVKYKAYPGEKPVFSGGKKITGWKKGEGELWKTEVPEVKEGKWYFRQLFVNGVRCRSARMPDNGSYTIAGGAEPAKQAFKFKPGDIKKDWTNLKDVEIIVLQHWMEARLRIDQVNEINNVVTFTGGSWRSLTWSTGYYVENVFEGLDAPGEWYLNRKTGILYYWPRIGEDMTGAEVTAPIAEELVRFEGDVDAGKFVRHITLQGITFSHTSWTLPERGYAYQQAAVTISPRTPYHAGWTQTYSGEFKEGRTYPHASVPIGAAIYGNGVRFCSLEDNTISHIGTWGIELLRGCQDNSIIGNHLYDVGAGGIKIGETINADTDEGESCRTVISDNHIHDGCNVYLGAPCIWIGQSSGNLISHNEINGAWEWAISVGWTWGYMPPNRARDNIIEYNHIHHLGESEVGTHGSIYILGIQPGSAVRYNLIHHITGRGSGIVLDNGCMGIVIENNVVHNVQYAGYMSNFNCLGNLVQNNIFAFGGEQQMHRLGDLPPKEKQGRISNKVDQTGVFYRNIFYWKNSKLFKRDKWPNYDIIMDYNLYYDASGGQVKFLTHTFEEWKETRWGMDRHSIIADPLFADPDNGDFTLKPGSPAFKLGFKPIDLSGVGPRPRSQQVPK